ncbi:MAG: murein biosynthesis integral rane protein MurJ [Rickettsiaceae bacterium]|jgi:putative peptidoglycan lipid II flippase|nr:murein biosynthesis integral rane protein MurJ [Rickettsiaceae bacterium]
MRLFKSAFTISFFISLSRILGFIRDVLIAKYLGVGVLSDAFFAAFKLPNFFRRVFAEGAFNSAFVPIFVDKLHHHDNRKDAKDFVRDILSLLFFVLLIFIILLQIFMPFAMKMMFYGFSADAEKLSLLTNLSRITIFYLLFISITSLFSGILNSLGKFAAPSSVPIILNGTLIASIFVFGSVTPNLAYALSWGVFAAGVLQLLWLMFFLYRAGILVYPTFPKINSDIKHFFKKLLPGIVGANVMQINLLVDTMIASLISGAVSYLYYADRINQLPLAMIGIAINIALLPTLSKAIKLNEISKAMSLQNLALEASLILVIPATLALTCLAYPMIEVLFQRGAFGENETAAVAKALMFYSFGLPAFVMVKVLEPGFFARGNTKTPMNIALICLVNNVILNIIFFKPFGYVGIVLASVCSSYLNVSLLLWNLIKNKNFIFEENFAIKLVKIFIPAILMALILLASNWYLARLITPIANLICTIIIGLISYFAVAYLSGALNILKILKPKSNNPANVANSNY